MNRISAISAIAASLAVFGFSGAALAQDGGPKMFFSGDMVISPAEGTGGAHCVLASQYKHGDRVVFRVRVLDRDGKPVTDKEVTSMVVTLSSGEKVPMRYGGHPHDNPVDSFWSAGWTVPADYPAGSLSYSVVATTAAGDTESWAPFAVAQSQLTVLPDGM